MQLITILCKFRRATGSSPMQLKTMLSEIGHRSAQLDMLLCRWEQFYESLNRSVQQEMLLCSWKQFYVYLDRSVQQDILLERSDWKQFYASMDTGQICATKDSHVQLEPNLYISWQELHFEI